MFFTIFYSKVAFFVYQMRV